MKTLQTKYGLLNADEVEDKKFITSVEHGEYPNDDIIEILLKYCNPNTVFADVGANIGTITIALSKFVKEVHCFEPIPRNLEILKRNIEANHLTNVTINPYAIGDTAETLLFFEETAGNAGSYRWSAKEGFPVEVRTLDSFKQPFNAIKIDVQGMESKVIEGAKNTIQENSPVIFFELSGRNLEIKDSFATIHKVLRTYNFFIPLENLYGKIFSLRLTTLLRLPGVVLLGREGKHFDIVAIPKQHAVPHLGSLRTIWTLVRQMLRTKVLM